MSISCRIDISDIQENNWVSSPTSNPTTQLFVGLLNTTFPKLLDYTFKICSSNRRIIAKMTQLCLECIEAEEKTGIDISRLLERLTSIKGKLLSHSETIYLCLSLCCCYSNLQIAYRLSKHRFPTLEELSSCADIKRIERNMKSEMSDRVNAYIKIMMNLESDERRPSWFNIIEFLNKNGYKKNQAVSKASLNTKQEFFLLCEGNKLPEEVIEILRQHGMRTLIIKRVI